MQQNVRQMTYIVIVIVSQHVSALFEPSSGARSHIYQSPILRRWFFNLTFLKVLIVLAHLPASSKTVLFQGSSKVSATTSFDIEKERNHISGVDGILKYSSMYCMWKVAGNSPGHFSIAVYTQHRQLLPSASVATWRRNLSTAIPFQH